MKKSNRQNGQRDSLSLDGMMSLNRSYSPGRSGGRQKSQLGEKLKSKIDGFYPQRADADIGRPSLEGSLSAQPIAYEEDDVVELSSIDKPAKSRRFLKKPWPFNRKSKLKSPLDKRSMLKRAGIALILLAIAGGVFFGFRFWQTTHDIFHGGGTSAGLDRCQNINELRKEGDCRVNILMLGIGGPGHDGSDLTDTMLLASVDPVNNTVALLSIPRDLWVKMPNNFVSDYGKINSVYEAGKYAYLGSENSTNGNSGAIRAGFKSVDQTISSVMGVNVNYNVLVDFHAFKQAVDSIGGVDVSVKSSDPRGLYDPSLDYSKGANCCTMVNLSNGWHHLNGQQALDFARARGDSPGSYGFEASDFQRTKDQREIMVAIEKKVLTLGTFSNPSKVSKLMSSFGSNVFTDLAVGDLSPLYTIAEETPGQDITSLNLPISAPGNLLTTTSINGASVVVPVAGTFDYSQLIPFVRSTLRDGQLAYENATVAVYNATSQAGLATDQSTLLKSYGYRITDVGSAPNSTSPANTTLVDLSGGKDPYTRHYLELRFKTTAVSALPSQYGIKLKEQPAFVIILGQDASTASSSSTTAG